MLFLPRLVSGNEYVPPPTGPYHSTVVINTVEESSEKKQQVYKFPQEDLFQPRNTEPLFPSQTGQGHGFDSTNNPASGFGVPRRNPPTAAVDEARTAPSSQAAQPRYDQSLYDNPWSVDTTRPQQGYQGDWNTQYSPYGYYQYPYGYSNQYNTKNNPFSYMPSPWSVMPSKPYPGR